MKPSTVIKAEEAPCFSDKPDYLRVVGEGESAIDTAKQIISNVPGVRDRISNLWQNLRSTFSDSEKRSDAFWNDLFVEKSIINAIMSGDNPELARIKALIAIGREKNDSLQKQKRVI